MRRRADGTYEAIDWDTAIREIAAKFRTVIARHGSESILYYGGGGQGNHLGGTYGDATLKALGVRYRSNALAQEKSGEFWVQGKMFGAPGHGDYEHAQVSVFIGKNPWQSHGFARARTALLAMQKDPARSLVVIDPRRSETAAMADMHLAIAPGTDAWCLAAIIGVIVQEQLVNTAWVQAHTTGAEEVLATFDRVPVAAYATICGVPEAQLRDTARLIARADSVSVFEDLGLQMNLHSTLNSYLQRLMWTLTGHYGRPGTANAFVPFLSLAKASKGETSDSIASGPRVERRSPVTGAKIVIGLIPCNVIPDEILTDHPKRFRAMLIESGNPAHSLADSQRMREAIRSLELSVVIDVAMTETARIADYVLPAASQFEKVEATFFNTEFPRNTFHLRQPLFAPLPGTLPEAEIHARLCEALGALSSRDYWPLRIAARLGRTPFTLVFGVMSALRPSTMRFAPVLLYRTLGETLPARAALCIASCGELHSGLSGPIARSRRARDSPGLRRPLRIGSFNSSSIRHRASSSPSRRTMRAGRQSGGRSIASGSRSPSCSQKPRRSRPPPLRTTTSSPLCCRRGSDVPTRAIRRCAMRRGMCVAGMGRCACTLRMRRALAARTASACGCRRVGAVSRSRWRRRLPCASAVSRSRMVRAFATSARRVSGWSAAWRRTN